MYNCLRIFLILFKIGNLNKQKQVPFAMDSYILHTTEKLTLHNFWAFQIFLKLIDSEDKIEQLSKSCTCHRKYCAFS